MNNNIKEIGHIVSFFSGVAKIQGLPHVFVHEVLLDNGGKPVAIVIGFDDNFVEALFFDENYNTEKPIFRSNNLFSIAISKKHLGRIIDGIGSPIDKFGVLSGKQFSVFQIAPEIKDREPIGDPLTTGIKVIDTSLPLGRGQRELIIGDQKLGKSTLTIDIVSNQKNADPFVYCIYVICGQKIKQLQEIISHFKERNCFFHSVIVAATANDSFALQYLAPFVGCTIGEYFRDRGQDALVIYDDLTKHAKAYRDISLLLERPPGREAYPGDIFSLHAGLLERSGKLSKDNGGGSLTALPIAETQEGDITSFIPTNLISITDGQIFIDSGLYHNGFLPAINVGFSVSRVGSQCQPNPLIEVTRGIRLALSQHKELQKLIQFETTLSKETIKNIHRGELIVELLKQKKHTYISWPEQAVLFYLVEEGFFDDIKKEKWSELEKLLLDLIITQYQDVLKKIKKGKFDDKIKSKIQTIASDFKKEFIIKK